MYRLKANKGGGEEGRWCMCTGKTGFYTHRQKPSDSLSRHPPTPHSAHTHIHTRPKNKWRPQGRLVQGPILLFILSFFGCFEVAFALFFWLDCQGRRREGWGGAVGCFVVSLFFCVCFLLLNCGGWLFSFFLRSYVWFCSWFVIFLAGGHVVMFFFSYQIFEMGLLVLSKVEKGETKGGK